MNYSKALEKALKGNVLKRANYDVYMEFLPFEKEIIFQINGEIVEDCRFSDKIATDWEIVESNLVSINPFIPMILVGGQVINNEIGGTVYA